MRGRMRAAVRVAMVLLAAACGGGGDPVVPDVAPTVTVSASGGSATVAAGSTLSLAARVTDKRAQLVTSPSVVWSSSTPTVAVVSPDGVVTATTVGQTTISAASLGATGTIAVTVTAGAPAKLFIRTQPADVPSGTAFVAPPVVEVRDALDNLVTAASVPVMPSTCCVRRIRESPRPKLQLMLFLFVAQPAINLLIELKQLLYQELQSV